MKPFQKVLVAPNFWLSNNCDFLASQNWGVIVSISQNERNKQVTNLSLERHWHILNEQAEKTNHMIISGGPEAKKVDVLMCSVNSNAHFIEQTASIQIKCRN